MFEKEGRGSNGIFQLLLKTAMNKYMGRKACFSHYSLPSGHMETAELDNSPVKINAKNIQNMS